MPISMECPSCMNGFSVPDETAGRKTKCPECQFVLFVPRADTAVDAAPPGPTTKTDSPAVSAIEVVEAVRPAPSKKSRAVARAPAEPAVSTPAATNPFAFDESDDDPRPSRRRRGAGWGTVLVAGFLIVVLGGLLVLGVGGAALWYFLSQRPATVGNSSSSSALQNDAPAPDAKKPDEKEPPKKEPPKEDPPKDPGGKPVRDPVGPAPPADPKPTRGKLTLSPIPEQNVKPGERFTFNVSVLREDCKGNVVIEVRGGEIGIKVNRALQLPADVDRTTLTAEVEANAPIGKHVLTVTAKLGAFSHSTSFEVNVRKPGAPVAVNPPPDSNNPPLQLLNARGFVDGRVYDGHTGSVECVALSADKKWAASGGVDGFVRLLELDKAQSAVIHGPTTKVPVAITAVAFSADGKWVAYGDASGAAFVYDVAKNESRPLLLNKRAGPPPKDNPVRSLDLSPQGDTVVATTKLYISSWEVATGKQVAVNDTVRDAGRVRFAADGKCYAVNGAHITVFDPQRGEAAFLGGPVGKPAEYSALTFDVYPSRGDLVAVVRKGDKTELHRINTKTGQAVREAELPADTTALAVADKAGCALAGDKQGNIRAYVIDAGKEWIKFSPHKGEVRGLAVSADGRRAVSAGADGKVGVYDFRNEGDKPAVSPPPPPPPPPPPVAAPTYERKAEIAPHRGEARQLAFSPDGKWLASGGRDGKAVILDAATGKVVKELDHQTRDAAVVALSFSGDGKWLLVGNAGRANDSGYGVLWEVAGWKYKGVLLGGHKKLLGGMSLSQDGKKAVSLGTDPAPSALVWDLPALRHGQRFTDEHLQPFRSALSADAMLAVTHSDRMPPDVTLWDLAGRQVLGQFKPQRAVQGVAFSGDGSRVVGWGQDPAVVVFDVKNFNQPKVLVERGHATAAALAPDGKLALMGGAQGDVSVWDVDAGRELPKPPQPPANSPITAAAFSAKAERFAVGRADGRVFIYAAADRK